MSTNTNSHPGPYSQDGHEEMYGDNNSSINTGMANSYTYYEDPAIINPEELATFPKQVKSSSGYHHHESHLVNKRTPVRDGRNITRTDNHPDKNGFM